MCTPCNYKGFNILTPELLGAYLLENQTEQLLVNFESAVYDFFEWEVFLDLLIVYRIFCFVQYSVIVRKVPSSKLIYQIVQA